MFGRSDQVQEDYQDYKTRWKYAADERWMIHHEFVISPAVRGWKRFMLMGGLHYPYLSTLIVKVCLVS